MDTNNITGTDLQATPSQDGVVPVSGMKGINRAPVEEIDWGKAFSGAHKSTTPFTGPVGHILPEDYGESTYDKDIAVSEVLEGGNLENLRARQQAGITKIGNSLLGAASLAGTTFVRGTAGLLYGAAQGIYEGRFSALWDNDINNAMGDWDSFMDEQAPIYLSDYEKENPWRSALSAGNISNNLIKNAGFMIGAALSGQAYSGILQGLGIANKIGSGIASINNSTKLGNAAKAGYELGKATLKKQASGIGSQALVSTLSAIGEGSYEAQNNSKAYEEQQLPLRREEFERTMADPNIQKELLRQAQSTISLDDFTVYSPEGQKIIDFEGHRQATSEAYNNIVTQEWQKIEEEVHKQALKMGNADMLLNIPLLAVTNWISFGRLLRGGFKANKAVSGIKGDFIKGFTTASTKAAKAKKIGAGLISPLTEGFEEMNQAAIAEGAAIWRTSELDSFIDDRYNKEAERETSSFMQSMWQGLVDTYGTKDNWLEFVYGAAMGIMPIPIAKRTSKGNIGLRWNWEALNKVRDVREAGEEANQLVNYLNQRVEDPKFQAEWNSLVANSHLQTKMNETTADPFNFKNYEHRQTVHDLMAIEKAGKLDLFKEQLNDWASQPFTEEFVDSLKDAATDESGKSWMDGMSREEIYNTYQKNNKEILDEVEYYAQAARNIKVNYGDVFSDDALDEMVYIRTQIKNWQDRGSSIRESLGTDVITSLQKTAETLGASDNQKTLINWLGNSSDSTAFIAEKEFDNVNNFLSVIVGQSDIVDKDQVLKNLTDLIRISVSLTNGIGTYNNYLQSPDKLEKKLAKKKAEKNKETKKEEDAESVASIKGQINSATTFSDLNTALDASIVDNLGELDVEDSESLTGAQEVVRNISTTREVAAVKAEKSATPEDIAAAELITMVTEQLPEQGVTDPEDIMADYATALEEAVLSGALNIPEGFDPAEFANIVLDSVEATLNEADELIIKYQSAPDIELADPFEGYENIPDNPEAGAQTILVADTQKEGVDAPIKPLDINEELKIAASSTVKGSSANMLYTAVPEIHKEAAKFVDGSNAIVTPADPEWEIWERQYDPNRTPTDFSAMYQKLQSLGAFDYLRGHVLEPGTEVMYIAYPDFVGANLEKYGIPIFFAITDPITGKLQVIGAAPSYKTTKVEKLKQIGEQLEKVAQEATTPGYVVSSETTRVSAVYDGTLSRSTPVPKTVDSTYVGDANTSLGIVVNGQIFTKDGSIPRAKLSTSVSDLSIYNGRPILLVQAPSGRYKLIPLRTKMLGTDIPISRTDNPLIQRLSEKIDAVIKDPSKANLMDMKSLLYIPDVYIRAAKDGLGGTNLIFTIKEDDGKYREGHTPVSLVESIVSETPYTKEDIRDNILSALASLNAKFQVSVRLLETDSAAEKAYIDSGVLYTDIDSPKIYGSWAVFEDGAQSTKEKAAKVEEALTGQDEVVLGNKSYIKSSEGWRDSKGSLVMDPRTVASLNRKVTVSSKPEAAPRPKVGVINTFRVGRVSTPRVTVAKAKSSTTINNSQNGLENTNNLLIFAQLEQSKQDFLTQKGISEADFNTMTKEQQDKIIECYS